MPVKLTIPDLGDFKDVEVIEVIAAPGDEVAVEDPLITLETDKATMDVPAEQAGTIVSIDVKVGDRVSQGGALVTLEPAGDEAPAAEPAKPASEAAAPDVVAAAHPDGDATHKAQIRTN